MLWHALERGPVVIGRNAECDLCIPHADVAPVHAVICRDPASVLLTNRSAAGTLVNGSVVKSEMQLARGDCIQLGELSAILRFVEADGAEPVTRTLTGSGQSAEGSATIEVAGRRYVVGGRPVVIGADAGADIVIDDPYASGLHAQLWLDAGRLTVRDLHSRNGVYLGAQRVSEAEVLPNVPIRIGKTTLLVCAVKEAEIPCSYVAEAEASKQMMSLVARLAAHDAPVLVTGETGTGKEVVAALLHELSPRRSRPFVAVNCGALSLTLIESELFGHERGAFTGAIGRKVGAFEAAADGTLFLDEIGELPVELQPKLLRVLENQEIHRVGGVDVVRARCRIVAATNRRLDEDLSSGRFREDLFHRLHILPVLIAPLRERQEDILPLARHFIGKLSGTTVSLSEAACERLLAHHWPGNVRELRNVIQRALVLRQTPVLEASDITFPPSTLETRVATHTATSKRTLLEVEKQALRDELSRNGGNKSDAARALGISRSTLHRKLAEHGLAENEVA